MTDKAGRLQIDEDLTFQRREWRAQRVGWFVLCAFLVAALLGVFGAGPLSHARAGERGSTLWVEYERFVRQGATERLSIHLAASGTRESLDIRVSRPYFDALRIERITPEPDVVEVGAADVVLRFTGEAARSSSVVLDGEPLTIGRQVGTFTSAGTAPVVLTQFVYF